MYGTLHKKTNKIHSIADGPFFEKIKFIYT